MPRVHFVKKARKDNSCVKKGESYYWWKFRYGGRMMSKTRPRNSQLTQSEKKSRAFACQEQVEDAFAEFNRLHDGEVLCEQLNDIASEVREIADEYRESADAVREHFGDTSNTDEMDEKADNLDSYADELESLSNDIESVDRPDEGDFDMENEDDKAQYDEKMEEYVNEISGKDGEACLEIY